MQALRVYQLILFLLLIIILIFACAPKPPVEEAPVVEEIPELQIYDLDITSINGTTEFTWKSDRQQGEPFGGYDIFVVPVEYESGESPEPLNETPYPGDVDGNPEVEEFTTTGIETGKVYKGWVRAYSVDRDIYTSTDTVRFSPMKKGEFTISLRYSTASSGYDFSRGRMVPARSPEADIMFFGSRGEPKLAAPEKLYREFADTRYFDMGMREQFNELIDYSRVRNAGKDSVPLKMGHIYLVRTADNHYAKVVCTGISGDGGRKKASFNYVYNPVKGYDRFR
ncbi:MAG: hypothetical protein GF315_00455 [candidate division Zixibacteria bacterium]|nr:hypothetical protein [candidate division Zixibacteria bacterium]